MKRFTPAKVAHKPKAPKGPMVERVQVVPYARAKHLGPFKPFTREEFDKAKAKPGAVEAALNRHYQKFPATLILKIGLAVETLRDVCLKEFARLRAQATAHNTALKQRQEKIMATQLEIVEQLRDVLASTLKTNEEIRGIKAAMVTVNANVKRLEDLLAAATTLEAIPELVAVKDELKASVKIADELIDDLVPEPSTPAPFPGGLENARLGTAGSQAPAAAPASQPTANPSKAQYPYPGSAKR